MWRNLSKIPCNFNLFFIHFVNTREGYVVTYVVFLQNVPSHLRHIILFIIIFLFTKSHQPDYMDTCLSMNGNTCSGKDSVSISFWVRMHAGKRILATGAYTVKEDGPGILFEYDVHNETMRVEFRQNERTWNVNIPMLRYRCNKFIKWK